MSHLHGDHASGLDLFSGARVFKAAEKATVMGVSLRGVECSRDDDRGRRLGSNLVWSFEVDGVKFTYTGDLGHHLSVRQLSEIGCTDVLFLNTGSDLALAEENAALLDPRVVVPMHYETPGLLFQRFKLKTLDEFTASKRGVVHVGRSHEYAQGTLLARRGPRLRAAYVIMGAEEPYPWKA